MKTLYFFFGLFILIGLSTLNAQIDLNHLDNYYENVAKDWEIPGMTVGIVKDGKLIFSKGYGTVEEGKKISPDGNTLYAIASNSKAFTSAMIAMLVQEGKLEWDQKVVDILPYFEIYDPYLSRLVTIRDLLCHRIGLGTFSGDVIWYKSNFSAEEIIRRIKSVPQAYDFRSGYGYSNLMYITAGEIISTVTGKSWADNVRERILIPLGMDRTVPSVKDLKNMDNLATPHRSRENKNIPIEWANWDNVAATGGLISSIEDLSKWAIFNLNNGIHEGKEMLSPESRNILWKPHNTHLVDLTKENDFNRHFNGYALGWGVSDYHGRMRVGHTGGYDGMITAFNLIPDEDLGVIVLTNGMKSPIMAVTYYTIDHFLEGNKKDWSKDMLDSRNKSIDTDTRISSRKDARVMGTKTTISEEGMIGDYYDPMYGNITIKREGTKLRINFEHSPELSATLKHWHYDVWLIEWDEEHAWFSFGTLQFLTDNNLKVSGLKFDVPNDDIFFEELNPLKK